LFHFDVPLPDSVFPFAQMSAPLTTPETSTGHGSCGSDIPTLRGIEVTLRNEKKARRAGSALSLALMLGARQLVA